MNRSEITMAQYGLFFELLSLISVLITIAETYPRHWEIAFLLIRILSVSKHASSKMFTLIQHNQISYEQLEQ